MRTTALPTDFCILLTDTLESPATFLLTHFVGRALRDGRKTVLVGLSRGMEHYATILRKSVSTHHFFPFLVRCLVAGTAEALTRLRRT